MYANNVNDAISVDSDPVHVYKMYKEKRSPSMLEQDSYFEVQSTTNASEQVKQ